MFHYGFNNFHRSQLLSWVSKPFTVYVSKPFAVYVFFVESTETVLFGFSIFAEVRNAEFPNKKSAKSFHNWTMPGVVTVQGEPLLVINGVITLVNGFMNG